MDVGDPASQAGEHVLRRAHVEVDPRHVGLVANPLQPAVHHGHRPIAGKKTGHEEDGPPVTTRKAATAKNRIAQQRRQLAQRQRIRDPHRQGW